MILEVVYNDTGVRDRIKIPGNKCVVGRSSKADYQIDLECFSRNHFQIEWVNKEFYLTDLNSTNGIYVNSERLPAGVRVLFKNFFPVEVGGKVSISIFTDDSDSETPSPLRSPQSMGRAHSETNQTRTKFVNSGRKAAAPKQTRSSSGPQSYLKIFGLVCVLGFLGYYFYESHQKPKENIHPVAETNIITKTHLKVSSDELSKLPESNSCLEFGALCNDLGLIHPTERMATSSDKIFVFVNTQEQLAKLNSPYMNEFPLSDRTEYLLAYIAFHPKLVAEARKNSFKQIVAINVENIGDIVKARNAYALETSNMPELNEDGHKSFFSNLFYAGFHRPYKVHLKSFAEFTSL